MNRKARGIIFTLAGGICWGFSGCCGQYLFTEHDFDSKLLTVIRMLASGAILLAVSLVRYRGELFAVLRDRRDMLRILLYAIFGMMLCQYSYLTAIAYTNAATATVIQYTGPVMVVVVVCLLEKRLPRVYEVAAVLLAVGGTFLISTHGDIHTLQISQKGLFWCLLAAVTLVCYTMILGDTVKRRPVPVCNAYAFLIGGVVLFVLVRAWEYHMSLSLPGLLAVASIVIFGTVLGYTLYMQGVADIGPAKASIIACVEPVASAVISWLWLGTRFAAADLIGFVLIMSTVFILSKNKTDAAGGGREGSKMKLIAASQNKHKLVEINEITKGFGFELVPMNEAGLGDLEIEETGTTFEENSLIKAETVCRLTGCAAIADDSGLMVDALGGAPGVYSARFAGEHGDDAANRRKLLEELAEVPDGQRGAKFVCVITIVYPDGRRVVARGECPGAIIREERGNGGFGYDPLFVPEGLSQTFAEVPQEVKNSMSHRARALEKLSELLSDN